MPARPSFCFSQARIPACGSRAAARIARYTCGICKRNASWRHGPHTETPSPISLYVHPTHAGASHTAAPCYGRPRAGRERPRLGECSHVMYSDARARAAMSGSGGDGVRETHATGPARAWAHGVAGRHGERWSLAGDKGAAARRLGVRRAAPERRVDACAFARTRHRCGR